MLLAERVAALNEIGEDVKAQNAGIGGVFGRGDFHALRYA